MSLFRTLVLLVAVASLGACDSGPALDDPTAEDVQGVYDLSTYVFTPQATGIGAVNVQAYLVDESSYLELFGSGQAQLRYRFQGRVTSVVPGEIVASRTLVRLRFDSGFEDALDRLLLRSLASSPLRFERDGTTLVLSDGDDVPGVQTAVNLQALDATLYGGLTAIPGTLQLQATLRSDS